MEKMEYDVYMVTARYNGEEAKGVACFTKSLNIDPLSQYAQDGMKAAVSGPARVKFGGDVDFEMSFDKGEQIIPDDEFKKQLDAAKP